MPPRNPAFGAPVVDERYGFGEVRYFHRGEQVGTLLAADSFEFEFPSGFKGNGTVSSEDRSLGVWGWYARRGWRDARRGPDIAFHSRTRTEPTSPNMNAFDFDPGTKLWTVYLATMGSAWRLAPGSGEADMFVMLMPKGDVVWSELRDPEPEGSEGEWDRDE